MSSQPGRLFRLATASMPIVYSASELGYDDNETNKGTVQPILSPPQRPMINVNRHTFQVRLNTLDAPQANWIYAKITGTFVETFEVGAVCTGGVLAVEEVLPLETWTEVGIPPFLDVRIYDRRFSALRRRANVAAWRPENETELERFLSSGAAQSFWTRLLNSPGETFSDMTDEDHDVAEAEVFVQMLCFIAAAMYLRKYSPTMPSPPQPEIFPELLQSPAAPDTLFDRTVGVGLCRISTIPADPESTAMEVQRCLMAPVIISHHDTAFREHTNRTLDEPDPADQQADQAPGLIERMLTTFPLHLKNWAQVRYSHVLLQYFTPSTTV